MYAGVWVNYQAVTEYLAEFSHQYPVSVAQLRHADRDGRVLEWALEHAPECVHLIRIGICRTTGLVLYSN
jgi:hypothetical protein